jgi:two-component system, probable response regulator PhcQ
MMQAQDYKQLGILYVDDEEISLKYFRKAFEKDFRVLTALSADEACGIIDKERSSLALIITDQRMPGKSGVELLSFARQRHPNVIRILTTAYSDLNSAIAAVNNGAIYKYIVKPWDINDLKLTLMRALDYFVLLQERDMLLREKLSVLQRIIIADRVRSLAVLAAGLAHHIRNSMTALNTFLELTPLHLKLEDNAKAPEYWSDLLTMARRESDRILKIVHDVSQSTIEPDYKFEDVVPASAITDTVTRECEANKVPLTVNAAANLPSLQAHLPMLQRCFSVLVSRIAKHGSGQNKIQLEMGTDKIGTAAGISIRLNGDGKPWSPDEVAALFTAFAPSAEDPQDIGVDLLSAFFVVHHHGGSITVNQSAPGFVVTLPQDSRTITQSSLATDCLEKLFARLEREMTD